MVTLGFLEVVISLGISKSEGRCGEEALNPLCFLLKSLESRALTPNPFAKETVPSAMAGDGQDPREKEVSLCPNLYRN